MRGGTGSRSDSEDQPDDLPDRFESGTPNGVGIAGWGAGIRFVLECGMDAIRSREIAMTTALINGLMNIPGIVVHGPRDAQRCAAVVSFSAAGRSVSDIGLRLDDEHDVLCRVGLHCSPAAHRTIGTFPQGTVRLAPGCFTSPDDIRATLAAVKQVVQS